MAIPNSYQILQAVIEATPDAIFVKDLEGRYVLVNDAAARFLGKSPDDIIGKRDLELYPEETARRFIEDDRRVLATGQPQAFEGVATGPGVTQAYLVTKGVYRDANGQTLGLFGISHDITELRQANQTLDQTREALFRSQKMEAVGQLTGGIAHEFNNLMAVMLGNAEHLVQELHDRPALKAIAGRIANAVERGAQLTGDLLSFSRKQMLQPRLLDPGEVLRHMERFIRPSLGERHQLRIDLDSDAWRLVADPAQLDNALVNLIINARDAMGHGGAIRLEVHNAMIDAKGAKHLDVPEGRYVLFEVADTGTGMTPEVLRQAAEPFFTTKEVGKGTGLGLSMVHGFAKRQMPMRRKKWQEKKIPS